MIKFDNVSKRYAGGNDALSQVSFELAAGEMAFLTGRSGAGKSTLLMLILRLEKTSRGQVFVNGKNLNRLSRSQIPPHRRQIGVVFQDFNQIGVSVLVASHDLGLIAWLQHRIITLDNGKLVNDIDQPVVSMTEKTR